MAGISEITADSSKEFSQQSPLNESCEQSPIQEVGDNAKAIGGVSNAQVGLTNSPILPVGFGGSDLVEECEFSVKYGSIQELLVNVIKDHCL